jgi:hypothetical protein
MLYLLWLSRVRHLLGDSCVRLNNTVGLNNILREFFESLLTNFGFPEPFAAQGSVLATVPASTPVQIFY